MKKLIYLPNSNCANCGSWRDENNICESCLEMPEDEWEVLLHEEDIQNLPDFEECEYCGSFKKVNKKCDSCNS